MCGLSKQLTNVLRFRIWVNAQAEVSVYIDSMPALLSPSLSSDAILRFQLYRSKITSLALFSHSPNIPFQVQNPVLL